MRMRTNHESLSNFYARTIASFQKRSGLFNRQTDRLLTKNMLSCFGSFDRPWDMKMIGQRVVNGFDIRIGQEFLIRSISLSNSQLFRSLFGSFNVP